MPITEFEKPGTIIETQQKQPLKIQVLEHEISSTTTDLGKALRESVVDKTNQSRSNELNHCQDPEKIDRFFAENNIVPGQTIVIGLHGHGSNRNFIGGKVIYLNHTDKIITIKYPDSDEAVEFPFSAVVIQLPDQIQRTF